MKPTVLLIKVVLRSSKNSIAGWENGELKVRLNAVPEKGKANQELIALLAKALHLPKSSITIIGGETSRHKRLLIEGLSEDEIKERLSE